MEPVESIIFIRKRWMPCQMLAYGFKKEGDGYVLKKSFCNGDFLAILSVDTRGQITGRVIDTMTQEDYEPLRQEHSHGAYVNMVRSAYEELLNDVAASCCQNVLFASPQANRLAQAILADFQVTPDFPWKDSSRYQSYGAFRHSSNRKWFALIMNVKRSVLTRDKDSRPIDVLNIKIRPEEADTLHAVPGIYPAYHMNHRLWISVVLDDTLPDEKIMSLVQTSYQLTR